MSEDDGETKNLFNETFNIGQPTWLNACAGNNGFQNIEIYAEGYRVAPQILLDKLLSEGFTTSLVDSLVYPIVFCMRHAVELQIKDSITKLGKIRVNRKVEEFKISSSHDIGLIWDFFKEQSINTDSRYANLVSKINLYIKNIAEIDPTGQVFRYPHDNEDNKHLTKTPIVNLLLLKKRFGELEALLDELNKLNTMLIYEYQQNTYTKRLSRNDICQIAQRLPNRDQWKEVSFDEIKKNIKLVFSLNNNCFSDALIIIQNHYEFSQEVDMELPLKHSATRDYVLYFECLDALHPEKILSDQVDDGLDYFKRSPEYFNEMKKYDELESVCIKRILDSISLEALADIMTVYELGRIPDQYWSERYAVILKSELADIKLAEGDVKALSGKIRHRLQKTNAKSGILFALEKLGQKTILKGLSGV